MDSSRKLDPQLVDQGIDQSDNPLDRVQSSPPKSNSSRWKRQNIDAVLSNLEKSPVSELQKRKVHRSATMDAIWNKLDF